ncbi:MAG: hypothetical protein J0L97_04695 [Alphaproteobacteria bacterium]|nr:hypothetical protein [Alphaproteobacteria bacterium]
MNAPTPYEIKFLQTRKVVLRSAAMLGVVGAIGLGVFLYLMSQQQAAYDEEMRLNSTISGLNAKVQEMQLKYDKASKSLGLFEQLQRGSQTGDDALARLSASKQLDELKRQYRFSTFNIKIAPLVEEQDPSLRKPSAVVVSSAISLSYKGMTDEYVFSFLNSVLARLPGYVRVDKFTIKRLAPMDDAAVSLASRGGLPELVGGDIELRWFNLKEVAKPPAKQGGGT